MQIPVMAHAREEYLFQVGIAQQFLRSSMTNAFSVLHLCPGKQYLWPFDLLYAATKSHPTTPAKTTAIDTPVRECKGHQDCGSEGNTCAICCHHLYIRTFHAGLGLRSICMGASWSTFVHLVRSKPHGSGSSTKPCQAQKAPAGPDKTFVEFERQSRSQIHFCQYEQCRFDRTDPKSVCEGRRPGRYGRWTADNMIRPKIPRTSKGKSAVSWIQTVVLSLNQSVAWNSLNGL